MTLNESLGTQVNEVVTATQDLEPSHGNGNGSCHQTPRRHGNSVILQGYNVQLLAA